jgi:omega-hydroxy-beta-dihydromenaquinone-9 sulfotransferase
MPLEHKIIFIIGNSRSGTTMLGRVLGLNRDVYTFQELHFFENMVSPEELSKSLSSARAINILNKLIAIEVEGFHKQNDLTVYTEESIKIVQSIQSKTEKFRAIDIYNAYLMYWTKKKGKTIPCKQTPQNLFYVDEIMEYFPGARIINIVRDPRSVLLSQKNRWKRKLLGAKEIPFFEMLRVWVNYHPITISKLWVSAIRTIIDNEKSPHILSIKYEDLIDDPVKQVQSICDFCTIKYEDRMLNVPQVGSSIKKDNPNQIGIDKNKAMTWKNGRLSSTEIYLAQQISKKEMKLLGYGLEKCQPNYFYLIYLYLTFPLKVGLALVLNLHRMKNVIEAIKRRLA